MEKDKIVTKLHNLIKLDIDASAAYLQAIEKIDETSIKEQLLSFRDDHEHHVDGLSESLIKFGENPPERQKDFKGFLIEGFTSLRSITGTSGALSAMHSNEKLTNKKYKEAIEWDMPDEIHVKITEYFKDEQVHINYIKTKIEELKAHHAKK